MVLLPHFRVQSTLKQFLINFYFLAMHWQVRQQWEQYTSPWREGRSLNVGGLHISAVPWMTTATSSTNKPSGSFSSDGSSITSSPIRRNVSTRSSCSFLARSMFTFWPTRKSNDEFSANELAMRDTIAKLYLKQSTRAIVVYDFLFTIYLFTLTVTLNTGRNSQTKNASHHIIKTEAGLKGLYKIREITLSQNNYIIQCEAKNCTVLFLQ